MLSRTQARSWGWMAVLALCAALVVALSLKVHAVRSEVLLAERQLIALKRETMLLETEFQTRASQAQLAEWNSVEFGYVAPRARQFLEAERQLASFGQGPLPGAPPPLRLASAEGAGEGTAAPGGPAPMRSPVSGAPVTLAAAETEAGAGAVFAEAFGAFLIEASPIRPARAEPPRAVSPAGAGE
ncbi:hypothetical protein [Erythrobacter cryptus]|uniref:hypothetical protein n=1 Tax=Erythrobacter cryptus TaxID=196588 RepID=UPI00041A8825|nr:hypothetical protein [Erythrobacter cryptus]